MIFSPREAPVYGDEVLVISLPEPGSKFMEGAQLLAASSNDELYLVLRGRAQCHIVTMRHSQESSWLAPLPGHSCAEKITLSVVRRVAREDCELLLEGEFFYQYDSAYYLAQFLINSVNNPHALDDLELIKSDHFDLANEILSTLDQRLSSALRHTMLPDGWHLLGSEQDQESDEDYCRETLLHFTGRLGLHKTALFLLSKPGSEEALCTMNRDGLLPCGVAAQNGFTDMAELFSGYNTSGMITEVDESLDTDNGIIQNHGSNGTSLTFSTESHQDRTIGEHIEILRDMNAMMRRGRSPALRRQYQTEWPSASLQHEHSHHHTVPHQLMGQLGNQSHDHNDPTLLHTHFSEEPVYSKQVGETLERIYQDQKAHRANVGHLLTDSTVQGAQNIPEGNSSLQQYHSVRSGVHIPSEVLEKATRQYGILEGSLREVHGISEELMKIREESLQRRQQEDQTMRRLHLARFSTSCPTLDAHKKACLMSPIHEGDQHKSMLDLVEEVGHETAAGNGTSRISNRIQDAHRDMNGLVDDESVDGAVRICVNGVTVDSTADLSTTKNTSDSDNDRVVRRRRSGRVNLTRDEEMNRRRSWCPESPVHFGASNGEPLQNAIVNEARMKSMSLSHLYCDEGSDEDFSDGKELQADQQTQQFQEQYHQAGVPEKDGPEHSATLSRLNDGIPQTAQSLTDLSRTPQSRRLADGETKARTSSASGPQGLQGYQEWVSLGVTHSNMTKSLSTPSIPAATQAADDHKQRRREGKQPSGPSQKLIEDYDARFCRQDEIEEEEEENVSSSEKKEMTWKDFLNEELGGGDSDEKSKMAGRIKEEKKRKPSVFTRFQNSYRTKKQKDKETKPKHSHHFVAVSFSNAAQCNVCHKPMANKPALRCENCLINVHEHSCKDQVLSCDKYTSMKVLQREGSSPAAMIQDRQVAALQGQGTSLRSSNSFKLKDRSSSAPAKNPPLSSMLGPAHRHSLPAGSLLGSPPHGTTYLQWYHATSRFSVLDKAINETDETDGPVAGHDMGHSNSKRGYYDVDNNTGDDDTDLSVSECMSITETTSESLESLDTVGTAETFLLEEEPDLMLGVDEPEAWNVTADKKTLRKMNAKDIKRQDTIWELIQTEKHYVKRLKIMQKLFRDPMVRELNVLEEQAERMFPNLDHLVAIHATFLRNLLALQTINADRSVDEIGSLLVKQFSEGSAEKMKSAYGVFCSKHTEAIQLYKDFAKTDTKFRNFCRKISNLAVCEKRELPDFILGVTVRLSKYPILIEAILKSTKDKKDREQVSKALQCTKMVVHSVDQQVALYEKLMEVYRAFDSRTTTYRGKKFKRQDLIASGRHLLHAGAIGWKNARGRVVETHTLVLTDLVVFLQKSEQKYSFFMQDNKSCVVPLYKLLVREKRDERDSHGIYVISQNRKDPEMYELVCRTRDERDQWMHILLEAIKNCPEEEEVQQPEAVPEEERKKQDEKSAKVKEIIDKLHQKDEFIRECCDEKNRLMMELMEMSTAREDIPSHPGSQHDLPCSTSVEVVQKAIEEASHLTTILQGSGTPLSRSVSSVGEHFSGTYVNAAVPKRAETFAGFDTSFDSVPKSGPLAKKRFVQQFGDEDGRSPSEPSLQDTIYEDSVYSSERRAGLSPQSVPSSGSSSSLPHGSPSVWEQYSPGERNITAMEMSSEHGSLGELSASSVSSLVKPPTSPTSAEQMTSIVQLVSYLHNLMNLTTKQCTTVESLRAELAEAKEEISKLSADMHGRKNIYRHNQLEELRNLQENISRERQEWERTKEKEQEWLRQEKEQLEAKRMHLEKHENELRNKKADLKRERETLQRQIDMMREQGLLEPSTFMDPGHVVHTIDLDTVPSTDIHDAPAAGRHVQGHRRSASADFYQSVPGAPSDVDVSSEQDPRGMPRRPRHSVSSIHSFAGPGVKQHVPAHLMSTRNEQRVGGAKVQQLPLKLSMSSSSVGGGNAGSGSSHRQPHHHVHPRAASLSSLAGRPFGASPAPTHVSPSQAQGMITRNQNSRSTPSNLALVMKLAEPGSGGKSRGAASSNTSTAGSSAPGGPGSAPGGPGESSPDRVIYF